MALDDKILPKDILSLEKLGGYKISSYRDFHTEEKIKECFNRYPLLKILPLFNISNGNTKSNDKN